jgi:hypothetical protein
MNPIALVGIICLVLLVPLFFASKRGPENTAVDFMSALAKGDVDQLTKLSTIGNLPPDQVHKKWEDAINAAKYYRFAWRITDVSSASDTSAAVEMQLRRNLNTREGEDEMPHELPLVKVNGEWKVPVDQMDRDIFPYLPRP